MVESVIGKDEAPKPQVPPPWWRSLKLMPCGESKYLRSRGLETPAALRWSASVPYFEDGVQTGNYPAMLGPIVRAGKFITWHCTYLQNGQKAAVPHPRKILAPGIHGAAIPLYPFDGGELGVAEGIETAIAAHMLYKVPVWATLNAGNMAAFEWPEGITTLQIFADRDANYAGLAAAYALAHRAAKMKLDVMVYLPQREGDFNDELTRQEPPCTESK